MGGTAAVPGASRRPPTKIPWWSVLLMIFVFYPPTARPFALFTGKAAWERGMTEVVAEGGAMREILLTFLGLAAIGRLASRRTDRSTRAAPNILGWLLVVFAVLILASILWSDEPMFSLRRIVAFAMVGLAAFAYRRMPGEEFLRLAFFTTLAALAFGVAREVAAGMFHPWDPSYRFKGTLPHPNVMGWTCALAALSGLSLVHGLRRWRLAVALLFPLACLLLTRSRTSLTAFLGAAVFYAFLSLLRTRPAVVVASLFLAATAVVSVVWIDQGSPVAENAFKLGREDSGLEDLQGRTELWKEVLVYARARPWLGYGYDVFWSSNRIEEVATKFGWAPSNSHSNYLDVLLGLGGIGLVIFVSLLGAGTWLASRAAVRSGNTGDLFLAALLFFCGLHGFLETTLVGPCFLTFLYLTALVRLGLAPMHRGRSSSTEALRLT
jgi:exopolysaccharide production protein ExoQ